jgi:hypothetical protein
MASFRVIQLRRFGGPEVLTVGERPFQALVPGEVRMRSLASAVNHSKLGESGITIITRDASLMLRDPKSPRYRKYM